MKHAYNLQQQLQITATIPTIPTEYLKNTKFTF